MQVSLEVFYREREELRTATTRTEGAIIYVSQKIQALEKEQTQGDGAENTTPDAEI